MGSASNLRSHVHGVLVRPELPVNVGAAARALANMALGSLRIVGSPDILREDAFRTARHARPLLEQATFHPDLAGALWDQPWSLATSARTGSPFRPHPLPVRTAARDAVERLSLGQSTSVALVFGCEGDGLTNEEILLCNEVVTIPTPSSYPTLNLAQAVVVTAYEVNTAFLEREEPETGTDDAGWSRMVRGWVDLAGEVGFYRPQDPRKMRPRLQEVLSHLPRDPGAVRTLFGLLGQIRRHLKEGEPEYRSFTRGPRNQG